MEKSETRIVSVDGIDVEVCRKIYDELYDCKKYEENERRKRRRNRVVSYDYRDKKGRSVKDFVADANADTEREAVNTALFKEALKLLKEIDEDDIIIKLYYFGYTEVAVAREVGITQAAVNKRKNVLLEKVRKHLK